MSPPRGGWGAGAPPRGPAPSDFRASDIALSVVVALAVFVGAGGALSLSSLDRPAAAPEIDHGIGRPVRVVPVLDLDAPALKLGGQKNPARLPDRWIRPTTRPRVERRAYVSTKAGKEAQDVPPPDVKLAPSATPPPPPDAEITKQVDTPLPAVVDAGPAPNVDEKGHADGVKGGTEMDPLKARAVDLYRAKISAWFSSRFRVSGSGLPQADLVKYRVPAHVTLGADRTVASYTLTPSGNAAFDAAAKVALEGARGQALPPPPENYPDVAQSQINITFICRENRCD